MASIATEVDEIISRIAGASCNDFSATLSSLGFNSAMLSELVSDLNAFVEEKKPGTSVGPGEISGDMTIQAVIGLVTEKLG